MGIFDGIFNNEPQQEAAASQMNGLRQAYGAASGAINTGKVNTDADYAAALQPAQTNYNTSNAGQNAYANATGVNGAQGYADALSSFHTSPGYDWVLDQGNQNILRGQSQSGQLASGGTNIDLLNYGQGLANQNWQQYITNLQPFLGQATTAAGQIAATNTAKAGTDATAAGKLADLGWQTQTGIGNAGASADLAQTNANANALNFGLNAGKALMSYLPV